MYYVRSSWLDVKSQIYKGENLIIAKLAANKNKQFYVFDSNIKIIFPVHSTTKGKIERAVQWANAIAKDKRHGYDNRLETRWGQNGDYACSSFVIVAYEQAGVPVYSNGARVTADMFEAFIKSGFKDVTSEVNFKTCEGMKRGDILCTPGKHTEMFIGKKRLIGARGNAYGDSPENNKAGDQTGGEIVKSEYYNFPWTYCLRYVGFEKTTKVQCGSFKDKTNANNLKHIIKNKTKINTYVSKIGKWYVVRTGVMTLAEAKKKQNILKQYNFDAILVEK